MTRPVESWNHVYDTDTAPWVIEQPQPEIVALERDGWIRGRVLDAGCGAGERTIALNRRESGTGPQDLVERVDLTARDLVRPGGFRPGFGRLSRSASRSLANSRSAS